MAFTEAERATLATQSFTGVDEFGRLLLVTEALSIRETYRNSTPGDPMSGTSRRALEERYQEIGWLLSLHDKAKSIGTGSHFDQWVMESWPDIVVTSGTRLSNDAYTLNDFSFGEEKVIAVWPDMTTALEWKAGSPKRATSCNLVEIPLVTLIYLILEAPQLYAFILYDPKPSDGEWDLAEGGFRSLPEERLIAVDKDFIWGCARKRTMAGLPYGVLGLIKMKAERKGLSTARDILSFVHDEQNAACKYLKTMGEKPQKPCTKCFSGQWVFSPGFREVGLMPAKWRCKVCDFPWAEIWGVLSQPGYQTTAISLLGAESVLAFAELVGDAARQMALAEENPWVRRTRYYLGEDCPAQVRVALLPSLAHALEHCPPPEACSRCGETCFRFASLSPNLKAASWKCGYCGRTELVREGTPGSISEAGREPIPKNVQREVWQRDSGRCVECGSKENLEFDHIIPVSKGGANTTRNLQLLCLDCNRRKAANSPGEY